MPYFLALFYCCIVIPANNKFVQHIKSLSFLVKSHLMHFSFVFTSFFTFKKFARSLNILIHICSEFSFIPEFSNRSNCRLIFQSVDPRVSSLLLLLLLMVMCVSMSECVSHVQGRVRAVRVHI